MTDPANITPDELRAALKGRSDGVLARCVALLIRKNVLDARTALRTYQVSKSSLYSARIDLEGELSRTVRNATLTARIKGETRVAQLYPGNVLTTAAPLPKLTPLKS